LARTPNRAERRGRTSKTQSDAGLAAVIRDTARLWRKHGLGYDQTKYVVEHVRRDLILPRSTQWAPAQRRPSQSFRSRAPDPGCLPSRSRHGLMIKTLFLTGARVSEFVQVRVEDLHLDSDPPQIRLVHAKAGASRYVPILPSLAQELRAHLQVRRRGYLFESNRHTHYAVRTVQTMVAACAREAGMPSGCIRTCCGIRSRPSCSTPGTYRSTRCRIPRAPAPVDHPDLRRNQCARARRHLPARVELARLRR